MLYEIKPLRWKKRESSWTDVIEVYESCTPVCCFEIIKYLSGDWSYKYCFSEYYDDGGSLCKDLEDGKAKCEKIWTERIKKCLIEKE
jgi:hypothetical protein